MDSETDRRQLLKYGGVSLATVATTGCLGPLRERLQSLQGEEENDPERDRSYSTEPDTIGNDTSGVVERIETQDDEENTSSDVDIDELRDDMAVPEPLADPEPNAFGCTDATVAHSYMEKGDRVDFYNYRIENSDGESGRVTVGVFFYNADGRITDSVERRVFVNEGDSTSGRISASQSNREYPVYFLAVTEQDCS